MTIGSNKPLNISQKREASVSKDLCAQMRDSYTCIGLNPEKYSIETSLFHGIQLKYPQPWGKLFVLPIMITLHVKYLCITQ